MILYTVQHKEVYKQLVKNKRYFTDSKYICFKEFEKAYQWINTKAQEKISSWNTLRPVWCWTKKPDLRSYRFISNPDEPKKQEYVLLTLEVPDSLILLSHFGLWHCVLGNMEVCINEKEGQYWDKKLETYEREDLQEEIEKTWEKIILRPGETYPKSWSESYSGSPDDLQAIIPYIDISMVSKVREFTMVNKAKPIKKRLNI